MDRAASARQLRAAVLAAASFALGLAGHQRGGGHAVATGTLLFAAAYCVLAGLAYSRRRLSGPAVGAILLGNQVVLHVGLTLGAGSTAGSTAGPHTGHVEGLVPGPWMILSHLVATALTAATIVVVEGSYLVCTALLNRIGRAFRLFPNLVVVPLRARCGMAYCHLFWRSRHPGCVPGRGPPSPVFA